MGGSFTVRRVHPCADSMLRNPSTFTFPNLGLILQEGASGEEHGHWLLLEQACLKCRYVHHLYHSEGGL